MLVHAAAWQQDAARMPASPLRDGGGAREIERRGGNAHATSWRERLVRAWSAGFKIGGESWRWMQHNLPVPALVAHGLTATHAECLCTGPSQVAWRRLIRNRWQGKCPPHG